MVSTARRLLVATPTLPDPNFARTVIFMVEHTPEGALGVVLNRPTQVALDGSLPEWAALAAPPAVAFLGGPVQPEDAVIGLAQGSGFSAPDAVGALVDGVGAVDLTQSPLDTEPRVDAVRVFAGYAGWGQGQLEGELARRDWFVVDAFADDLFTPAPDALWRAVLRRQPGELAIAANFPPDLSSN